MRARAQALPEYAMIVAIVAAVAMVAFLAFRDQIIDAINSFTDQLNNVMTAN